MSKEKENELVYLHPLHIPTLLRLTVARLFLYGNTVYGIRRYGAIYGFFYEPCRRDAVTLLSRDLSTG